MNSFSTFRILFETPPFPLNPELNKKTNEIFVELGTEKAYETAFFVHATTKTGEGNQRADEHEMILLMRQIRHLGRAIQSWWWQPEFRGNCEASVIVSSRTKMAIVRTNVHAI